MCLIEGLFFVLTGLSIILFMENSEYIGGMTQGYGARVTINDQLTFPFPADEGFFVSSAFETHIGLKQVVWTHVHVLLFRNP